MDILTAGKRIFDIEIMALQKTREALDETFVSIVDSLTRCEGKVIITGMGKPGHIAAKIAATLSSLGTPSFYLHPAEALHGDLGVVSKLDVVLMISKSGESEEIIKIIPSIKLIGAIIIAITGNKNSTLAKAANIVQVLPKFEEACKLGLAPTSSTTVELCYGDALAVVTSEISGFGNMDYAVFHPAGSLGKRLVLKVKDLMAKNSDNACIYEESMIKEAIVELSKKGLGVVSVIDHSNNLVGIITDGDLRRQLERGADVYNLSVKDTMTKNPIIIDVNSLAINALKIMNEKNVSCLPVMNGRELCGTIRLHDIVNAGIVY